MVEAGLTRSRRAAKVGIESDPGVPRVFVPSCELVFHAVDDAQSSDCGWVDQVVWTPATNPPVAALAAALDNANLAFITGGHVDWDSTTLQPYYDGDCARSGYLATGQKSEMQTRVSGSGTLTFYWKIAGDDYYDTLEIFVDGVSKGSINRTQAWIVKQVPITGDGNHTLLWRYTESGGSSSYAYVDYVQWTGAGPIEG